MSKFSFKKLIPAGIGLITFAAFVGSISGSLAWWAYSTRASVSYQGTSVTTSEQLQIGLKLDATSDNIDTVISSLTTLGLVEDTELANTNYRYIFANAGSGLTATVIKTYLEKEGLYATDELAPVTTRTYTEGSDLHLYESLIQGDALNNTTADKSKYVHIPFVFRIIKLNAVSTDDKYAGGRKIYLSKAIAEASNDNPSSKIQNAIRVHFNNGTASEQFILNAGDTTTTDASQMYTNVAGCLDLDGDGYYDNNGGTEIMYGDYTGSATNTFVQDTDSTELSDLNGIGTDVSDLENHSTFLARHRNGNTCYEDYSGLTLGKAYYKTLESIKPDDSSAILSGGRTLCTTASTGNCLAELETTIWLEGWDHEVVDSEISHKFNLGLQFQIDLVS